MEDPFEWVLQIGLHTKKAFTKLALQIDQPLPRMTPCRPIGLPGRLNLAPERRLATKNCRSFTKMMTLSLSCSLLPGSQVEQIGKDLK